LEARRAYFHQLLQKVRETPDVVSAGISTNATPPDNGWEQRFEISGKPVGEQQRARINFISPEYFSVLHIPLLQGRIWDESETMPRFQARAHQSDPGSPVFSQRRSSCSSIRVPD